MCLISFQELTVGGTGVNTWQIPWRLWVNNFGKRQAMQSARLKKLFGDIKLLLGNLFCTNDSQP